MQGHLIAEAMDDIVNWAGEQFSALQPAAATPATTAKTTPSTVKSNASSSDVWMAPPVRGTLSATKGITQNALTQMIQVAVTFPASGTAWAADIRYALFAVVGANVVGCEVHDGQGNVYAVSQRNSNGSGDECVVGSELSTVNFAPGSQVVFTLYATCNGAGTNAYQNEQISMGLTGTSFLSVTPTRIS